MHQTTQTLDRDGQLWYSDSYLKEQIEVAFQSGIYSGLNLHLNVHVSDRMLADSCTLIKEIQTIVNEEFKKQFDKGHVWAVAQKRQPFDLSIS